MKKAVLIGAGQFGRGVIGVSLYKSGYDVLFCDINKDIINDINERGGYTVHRMDKGESFDTVKCARAMLSSDSAVIDECAEADIICTCVGLNALEKISVVVAESIKKRYHSGLKEKINVLACENALGGSTILKRFVKNTLNKEENEYLDEHIGFPDCAIDGIIPPFKDNLPADVFAEEYHEWDALKSGFRGEIPNIEGLSVVEDLSRYLERKLFTLNGPNAVTGAMGYRKGYETVQQALEDKEIFDVVWSMMEEAGKILSLRHGFTDDEMLKYRSFIMERFKNPNVIDKCTRVVREPIRKLSQNDRIIAPLNYACIYKIKTPAYYKGIAEVMNYNNAEDFESVKLQKLISKKGFLNALEEITGIDPESKEAACILYEHLALERKKRK